MVGGCAGQWCPIEYLNAGMGKRAAISRTNSPKDHSWRVFGSRPFGSGGAVKYSSPVAPCFLF
jgi:hypothetical protein